MSMESDIADSQIYCPMCQRYLEATNAVQVWRGDDSGYVFVHDDVPHGDADMEALTHGIN